MTTGIQNAVALTATPTEYSTDVAAGYIRNYTHAIAYNPTAGAIYLDIFVCAESTSSSDITQICHQNIGAKESYLCVELIGAAVGALGNIEIAGDGLSFSCVYEDSVA